MKIWIECECILLNESLRLFLGDICSTKNECDFFITDQPHKISQNTASDASAMLASSSEPPAFLIGAAGDLAEPFTKKELFSALYEFYMRLGLNAVPAPQTSLEAAISDLVDDFKFNLIRLLREKL